MEDGTREAAVAAILVGSDENPPDILLIKRAKRADDPWSGQMAFPGGRRDPEDADLFDTVRRETFEETGIVLQSGDLVGELNDLRPLGPGLPRLIVRPFVFLLEAKPEVVLNHEVALSLWVDFSKLHGLAGSATVTVSGRNVVVPAYHVEHHIVWGLTERILNSFIVLCL